MATRTKRVSVRVFHNADGWTMSSDPDVQACSSNYHREQAGMLPCSAPAVWKVVESYPMHLTIGFWCADDMPAEHRHLAQSTDA